MNAIVGIAVALVTAVWVVPDGGEGRTRADLAAHLEPGRFTTRIDNPLLPLPPGARWVYEGHGGEGTKRIVVEVTNDRRTVMGVTCAVVRGTVTVDGEVVEDTYDWYAQDSDGNVWYFGENTNAYRGNVASTKGSWEAGVDGAQPGIVMRADPHVGDRYRQEYAPGEAADMHQVLSLRQKASVPYGLFDVVVIKDYDPLDPGSVDHKFYARGVGPVLEVAVQGGHEWVGLVEMSVPWLAPERRRTASEGDRGGFYGRDGSTA
jgi:hypothetical protein